MPNPRSRRLRAVLAVVSVVVACGIAATVVLLRAPGNVSHPSVQFSSPTTAHAAPPPADTFLWPLYGYNADRTRDFDPGDPLGLPLRVGWRFNDYALLEFPPVIDGPTLYVEDDDASVKAIDKHTGHKLWEHKLGTLAAASPAIGTSQHLLYVPVLSINSHNPGNGALFALSLKDGHTAWELPVGPGTESSPLAFGNSVYFGDQSGTVYSLDAATGQVSWTYHATEAVKGGPALDHGVIYFGDYAGRAYALDARTGHQIWAVSTEGTQFGFGSGNFYSTPAVAFGRVYMGNTDGRVYSFAQSTGELAWATETGSYVYASPAVSVVTGAGPTVFIGSYDGNFYALDARSGAIRWTHAAGGKISGSSTVVGDVVYYSDLGSRTTTGLDTRSGRQVFGFPDGAFNPVVADPGVIYLTGYSMLYQMLPRR